MLTSHQLPLMFPQPLWEVPHVLWDSLWDPYEMCEEPFP